MMVTKRVSAVEAKAHLAALVGEVQHRGQHVIIERRGQAVAAIVGMDDLARLEGEQPTTSEPRGALAFLTVQHDLSDDAIDALVDTIYMQRSQDFGRPVDIEA
jgi:prevent-host-death family protein